MGRQLWFCYNPTSGEAPVRGFSWKRGTLYSTRIVNRVLIQDANHE